MAAYKPCENKKDRLDAPHPHTHKTVTPHKYGDYTLPCYQNSDKENDCRGSYLCIWTFKVTQV